MWNMAKNIGMTIDMFEVMMVEMDENGDGIIQKDEWMGYMTKLKEMNITKNCNESQYT